MRKITNRGNSGKAESVVTLYHQYRKQTHF